MSLAERVQIIIDRRGLTQGQVELKTGIDQGHFSTILKGKRPNPRLDTLVRLAQGLGVSLNYLAGLPEPVPGALQPDEMELLRDYQKIQNEDVKAMILNAAREAAEKGL